MPRERRVEFPLPPAVITEDLLKRIAEAIPAPLQSYATWNIGFAGESVSEADLDALLVEIKHETHIDELSLEILDSKNPKHALTLQCEVDLLWISYNIAQERESDFRELAASVAKIFKQNSRLRARIPRRLRLWGFLRGPTFLIGNVHKPILSQLNWTSVTQDIIARFVAHTVTLFVGILLGWLIGYFGPNF